MYGVKRTTVYLPEDMKRAIEREAARRRVTEAEVIREAVRNALAAEQHQTREFPLFEDPLGFDLAGRVEAILGDAETR